MGVFVNASIMLGAVTETESLKETVETVSLICEHSDIAEILICYSPHATLGCLSAIEEITATDYGVPVNAFMQKRPFMMGVVDMMEVATGSHCISLSSDMALDLDSVPKMLELVKKEPDTIFSCSRWLPECKMYNYGTVRRFLNCIAQKYLRILFHSTLTDFTIPSQIAPTKLYQSIRWENEGFSLLLEMVLKPLRLGYKFVEIPTNCYARTEGKSSNSFWQTASYLKTSIHIRFMKRDKILK